MSLGRQRQPTLRAIFWDNDGVLVDTEPLYFEATRDTLADAGVVLTEPEYIEVSLRQGRSVFDRVRDRFDDDAIEHMRRMRNQRYAEHLRNGVAPLPGVDSALAAFHRRATQAIVTSSNHDHFEIIHTNTGLLRWFDFTITHRDYTHSKPHPEPYLTALARAGCTPEEAIAIEDSERGLTAARAAGLRCIVIPRGLTRGGNFSGAYRVVPDCQALQPILTDLLAP